MLEPGRDEVDCLFGAGSSSSDEPETTSARLAGIALGAGLALDAGAGAGGGLRESSRTTSDRFCQSALRQSERLLGQGIGLTEAGFGKCLEVEVEADLEVDALDLGSGSSSSLSTATSVLSKRLVALCHTMKCL